ncbi:hypothetical protein MTBPR1_120003 [Candidatus Terasakiella magnetica]|uniref:Uncharacterized protein n=1 Tax=Candidatus Terasakiella magnetica TaxID=1867952 RepID=A0A1C3REI3_9PROT|nr:hypothetical protein MTBPR1_120003 [Candidatus Terasakiella magnetica]
MPIKWGEMIPAPAGLAKNIKNAVVHSLQFMSNCKDVNG